MIVDAIITDSRSYGDFDKPGIKRVFKKLKPDYEPPKRMKVSRRLGKKYKGVLAKLRKLLSKQEYLALTSDIWKNKKLEYFLGLTVHFFDKNLDYRSLVLSFRKFKKSHHNGNIRSFILREIDYAGILDKVVSITTDNEATVSLACKDLNEKEISHLVCKCHNINLSVKNGLGLWKK